MNTDLTRLNNKTAVNHAKKRLWLSLRPAFYILLVKQGFE